MQVSLNELFRDYEAGMSQFQKDYFVTTKSGCTPYGQYKQALRELYARFRSLRDSVYKHEILKIDIKELYEKLEKDEFENKWERARQEVELKRKILSYEESQRSIESVEIEFNRFYQHAVFLKQYLEKQYGELTEEKKEKLEEEMWEHKTKEYAAMDFITSGRIGKSTYEILTSLPKNARINVLQGISNPQVLVEWYQQQSLVIIPKDLTHISVPKRDEVVQIDYKPKIEMD
jgi:hypothetical protein